MYLLDNSGSIVDSEFSLDVEDGLSCVVVESSGGANPAAGITRRNPDYNQFLNLLLGRLRDAGAKIDQIVLDSRPVADLPREEREASVEQGYPVDLATVDIDEFRRSFGRSIANMHRSPDARAGGNAQKRIRIYVDRRLSPDDLVGANEPSVVAEEPADYSPGLNQTEREYLQKARIGQGKFRDRLLEKFDSTCPVTGISHASLLVASHIKPWKACTNSERLDESNGILLSALVDRLFDKGLITFSPAGVIEVSPDLSPADRARCLPESPPQLILNEASNRYMDYHRGIVFHG